MSQCLCSAVHNCSKHVIVIIFNNNFLFVETFLPKHPYVFMLRSTNVATYHIIYIIHNTLCCNVSCFVFVFFLTFVFSVEKSTVVIDSRRI